MLRHHQRNDQIKRQWKILLALSDREWFSLGEIRDCIPHPPHKRTILRDMEALSGVFPIERRLFRRVNHEEFQYRLRRSLQTLLRGTGRTK